MSAKRKAAHIHPSRRGQVPDEPRQKRQKPDNAGAKSFKKAHPVNELKSQIRSLKRLLDRNDGLPADVRVEKERALQTARHELDEAENAQHRNEMIGRYHKIRFFDRQKATKRLKQAEKALRDSEDVDERHATLVKRVENAQVDVNYAKYYPLDRHYVSLFPRKKSKKDDEDDDDDGGDEHGVDEIEASAKRKGDVDTWERVKKCMADGTLDALRNGKLTEAEGSAPAKNGKHMEQRDTISRSADLQRESFASGEVGELNKGYDGSEDGFFE